MNKGYLYNNGQLVISDDSKSGIKGIIEFRSDIKEISIQQNVIEFLEKKLKENQEECIRLKENIKYFSRKLIPAIILISTSAAIFVSFISPLMHLGLNEFNFIKTVMENFSMAVTIFGVISVIFSGFFLSLNRDKKRIIKGTELQNKYIEQELELEKEKLKQIIKNPVTNNLSQNDLVDGQIFAVDASEEIKAKNNHLNIFFNCGNNTKLFKRLKRNGSLQLALQREGLSAFEIQIITDYLKPKQKVLSK